MVSYEGPVQVTYDASPPDGSPGVLLGFLAATWFRDAAALGLGMDLEIAALESAITAGQEIRAPLLMVRSCATWKIQTSVALPVRVTSASMTGLSVVPVA